MQSQGNIAKWRKQEGDKVSYARIFRHICKMGKLFDLSDGEQCHLCAFIYFFFVCCHLIQIEVGDVLCEIETDKATLEFESLEEG